MNWGSKRHFVKEVTYVFEYWNLCEITREFDAQGPIKFVPKINDPFPIQVIEARNWKLAARLEEATGAVDIWAPQYEDPELLIAFLLHVPLRNTSIRPLMQIRVIYRFCRKISNWPALSVSRQGFCRFFRELWLLVRKCANCVCMCVLIYAGFDLLKRNSWP